MVLFYFGFTPHMIVIGNLFVTKSSMVQVNLGNGGMDSHTFLWDWENINNNLDYVRTFNNLPIIL